MADDVAEKDKEITELTELGAQAVSGVHSPANGTPFLVIKSTDNKPSFATGKGGAARKGARKRAQKAHEPGHDDPLSPEEIEEEMTAKAEGELIKSPGVPDASVATPTEAGQIADTGTSGAKLAPMTKPAIPVEHPTPALSVGGESRYGVVGDPGFTAMHDISTPLDKADFEKASAYAVANIMEAMARIADGRAQAQEPKDEYAAALELIARKAFAFKDSDDDEGKEPDGDKDDAKKSGRKISAATQANLEAAAQHIRSVLDSAGPSTGTAAGSEEDHIMTTLTKEELGNTIAQTALEAVKAALKQERKAAKEKAKVARKAEAKKNANNGGDISESEMRGGVHGEHPANDVNAVKSDENGKVTKAAAVVQEVGTLTAAIKSLEGSVERMYKRKAGGGPSLTGSLPLEGRLSEPVAKSGESEEIQNLTKSLAEEMGKPGPEHAARASELSQQLTLARLRAAHESGQI